MRVLWKTSLLLVVLVLLGGVVTIPIWRGWLAPQQTADAPHDHHGDAPERVKLSAQARANLKIKVQKLEPVAVHWRTMEAPGWVVEKQGSCERVVSAPVAGVIKHIAAVRGDLLVPGERLFTLEIVSEQIHNAQAALYKARRELQYYEKEKQRLLEPVQSGVAPMARILELNKQIDLLQQSSASLERELMLRGLSKLDVEAIKEGKFIQRLVIPVPEFEGAVHHLAGSDAPDSPGHETLYELEELKVMLGESVAAGAPLCVLADHHHLQIEGRVFTSDASLIQKAARDGVHVAVEFPGGEQAGWPPLQRAFKITFVSNRVDPQHQTLNFYLPLPNQFQSYTRGTKTYRLWRFHPGQRVQLKIPVEAFHDVFVVPAEAVVRDGPDTVVFRENGDFFERKPVHLLYSDRQVAVLARDGSVHTGTVIASTGAVQINWAIKAQAGGGGHGHHHDHEH